MELGIFMQSLTGQPMVSSETGLSDKANPMRRWPSSLEIATGEGNASFIQTVRQILGQDSGDCHPNGSRAGSAQQWCEDPQTMLLIEMVGQNVLNDLAVKFEAGQDSSAVTVQTDVQDLLSEQLVALQTTTRETIGDISDATAEISGQTLTAVESAMNQILGQNQSSEPMGAIDVPKATVNDGTASGGQSERKLSLPSQDKAEVPDFFKEIPDGTADKRMATSLKEGGRTVDFPTMPADTAHSNTTTNSLSDLKVAAHTGQNDRAADFSKVPADIRTNTDNMLEAKMEAVGQEKTETAGFAVKTADSIIKNDHSLAARIVQPKDMAEQQKGSLESSVRNGNDTSVTIQSHAVRQDDRRIEPEPLSRFRTDMSAQVDDGDTSIVEKQPPTTKGERQQTADAPVRMASPQRATPDALNYESPKATVTVDTIIAGKPSVPLAAGTPTQTPSNAAFHKVIMDQIVEKAVIRSSSDRSEMRIQLKPETLGDVRMSIVAEKNQLAVRMIADNPAVKDIIESQLHHLKAELDKQGITVEKIDVLVSADSDTSQNRGQFSQMSKNNSFGNGKRETGGQRRNQQSQSQNSDENEPDPSGDGINYFA